MVIFASVSANRREIRSKVIAAVEGAYAVSSVPAAAEEMTIFAGFAKHEVVITSSKAPARLPIN
ncbi:MAG: hypothetical protein ABL955_13335, partial [Elusimicrobiota bacterium]